MPARVRSNVPTEALRWSIERAGVEFGLGSQTLRKALAKNSTTPDVNGFYTTAQIVAAIYGALHVEKIRTQRARAQQLELQNAITKGEVVNRAELMKAFAQIADAIVSRIMASELSRTAKEDILRDISSWPVVLKDVAQRQTRLRNNNGNGQTPEENDNDERPRTKTAHRRKSAQTKERV
jgi:hypothetical protein